MNRQQWLVISGIVVMALLLTACGGSAAPAAPTTAPAAAPTTAPAAAPTTAPAAPTALDKVALQLKWVTQAQFAGYYAALEKGYYRDEGLDVQLLEGGVDILPHSVLAQGNADFAVAWVPKALATREQGGNITGYRVSYVDHSSAIEGQPRDDNQPRLQTIEAPQLIRRGAPGGALASGASDFL